MLCSLIVTAIRRLRIVGPALRSAPTTRAVGADVSYGSFNA
jgi:hypothetical protein